MSSVLSRAILGLLAAEPASGYGLAQRFRRTLERAWPARHPQIYPALAGLEDEGLVQVTAEGPRGRKTYAVTTAGVDEAQRWLRETSPDRTVRNEAVLRLFMLWLLDADEAVAFFDEEIAEHGARLEGFRETLAHEEARRALHGSAGGGIHLCASFALELAIRSEADYVDWARSCRDRIAAGADEWDAVRARRLAAVPG